MTDFVIIQSGDQGEPQPETATAIAIPFGHDAKDFQMPDYVLDHDSTARELPIFSLLFGGQFASFRLFRWCLRVFVFFVQALIARISKNTNVFGKRKFCFFEHRQIVRFAVSLRRANNLASRFINDNLRFYRVPLFLARIVSLLFFFGRSIGVSVTSTMTNSKLFSLSRKTFLPGNFKSRQFLSRFSIFSMVRETVASDNCQRLARWNWVGYSRQYSSVSKTWSVTANLHGLPDFFCTRRSSSWTNSQILTKVSGLTPQYRLNSSGESDLICSKLIRLLMSENAFIVKQLMQEV